MEKTWNELSAHINHFFLGRTMKRYMSAAILVKQKIDIYLEREGVKYTSKIVDESEIDWPKVSVDVTVELENYDAVLRLWEKLCKVGYQGISDNDINGVFISVEPTYHRSQ